MGQESRIQRQTKEEHEMSDEYRPEDEVEAHGPVIPDAPFTEGPQSGASEEEPDFEAHGPVGLGPAGAAPVTEGPGSAAPVTE